MAALLGAVGLWQHRLRPPVRAARASFARAYPAEPMRAAEVVADEPLRYLVCVWYGSVRPAHRCHFAVAKDTWTATELTDEEALPYFPKGPVR